MSQLKTLNLEDSAKLLNYIRQPIPSRPPNRRDIRNYLMTLLMIEGGLRCGELTNLLISDLTFESHPVHTLIIRQNIAKRKHERSIPLTERIKTSIAQNIPLWKASRHPFAANFAFTSGADNRRLSRRTIERIIKAAAMISIAKDIHPHTLRHTFASNLMRITNIRVVQKLLGHKSITSTQIYTHPNSVDLTNAINSLPKETNHVNDSD